MSEFTPITTQEQFDSLIADRLGRERAKYADYETLKEQAAGIEQLKADHQKALDEVNGKLSEANTKIAQFEHNDLVRKVAAEFKLDYEKAGGFISGKTEEELRASAEKLHGLIGNNSQGMPQFVPDNNSGDSLDKAMRKLFQ